MGGMVLRCADEFELEVVVGVSDRAGFDSCRYRRTCKTGPGPFQREKAVFRAVAEQVSQPFNGEVIRKPVDSRYNGRHGIVIEQRVDDAAYAVQASPEDIV